MIELLLGSMIMMSTLQTFGRSDNELEQADYVKRDNLYLAKKKISTKVSERKFCLKVVRLSNGS